MQNTFNKHKGILYAQYLTSLSIMIKTGKKTSFTFKILMNNGNSFSNQLNLKICQINFRESLINAKTSKIKFIAKCQLIKRQ